MYRVLEILRKQQGYISGEEIGKTLEISRAAIWKSIAKLRKEGYEIEAITNKGYRLVGSEDLYNKEEILHGLETKRMGQRVCFYDKIGTTNGALQELARKDAPEGTLAVAETMTQGRGRCGRSWDAPAGSGIWLSLLLRPQLPPYQLSTLTLLAGLGVTQAIRQATGVETQIKWPNDILLKGRKLSGILVEMESEMDMTHFVILGVGININTQKFPEELEHIATSLYLGEGRTFSRKTIMQHFLVVFEQMYDVFLQEGFAPFIEEYEKNCATLGREVKVMPVGRPAFLAKAVGITQRGELMIENAMGEQEVVFSGEVSIGR